MERVVEDYPHYGPSLIKCPKTSLKVVDMKFRRIGSAARMFVPASNLILVRSTV